MTSPQWSRRATRIAGFALAAFALSATPIANAQSVLSEPDFSGMFAPDDGARIVARDSQRGWNYVALGNSSFAPPYVNGVQTGPLVRVNDSGQLDLGWIVASGVRPGAAFVLSNGELLFNQVEVDSFSVPPTLSALQTLQRGTDGAFRAQPFQTSQWTHDPVNLAFGRWSIARDAQGNRYAVFLTAARAYTLRRITAAGVPDANWRLDIVDSGTITHLTVGADGSIFYAAERSDATGTRFLTINRTSANDSLRWSQPFSGTLIALTADAVGRPYLLGRDLSAPGKAPGTNLLRFDATGAVDAHWSPQLDALSASVFATLRVVNDRLVVVNIVNTGITLTATQLSLLDGNVLATRSVVGVSGIAFDDSDSTITITASTGIVLMTSNPSGFSERRIALSTGSDPVIVDIKRWGDGYVMGGRFEYWYGGVRYAKLMRLGADLKPDPTWQPGIIGIGSVNALAIDRNGGLLVGGDNLLATQSSLIRFTSQGQLDPLWRKSFDGAVNTVVAASDGDVFAGGRFGVVDGVSRPSIVRFQADGSMQTGWTQHAPWQPLPASPPWRFSGDGVQKILDAGDGGILVFWQQISLDLDGTLRWTRLLRAASGAVVTSASALDRVNANSVEQDPVSGRLFATQLVVDPATRLYRQVIVRLLPVTLEIDPFWSPPTVEADVAAITDMHLYLTNGRRLLRSANSATTDLAWTVGDRNRPALAGWIDTTREGDALMWPTRGAPLAIRSPTQEIGQRTAAVVRQLDRRWTSFSPVLRRSALSRQHPRKIISAHGL